METDVLCEILPDEICVWVSSALVSVNMLEQMEKMGARGAWAV